MLKKFPEKQVAAAIEELNKVRKSWMKRPDVTACDVGYKIKDNKLTDELAIRVHVKRKLPMEALNAYEAFNISGNQQSLGAFPIDVIEAEYAPDEMLEVVAMEDIDRTSRVNPLVGGISVGNPKITAGTLGAIVFDTGDGEVCLLSNWHVLCGSAPEVAGDPIYQPGVYDGGTAADTVANLKRWALNADMDAAIAHLNGTRSYSRDILGLSPIPGVTNPFLGMNVVKSGRTTQVTYGVIDGLSNSLTLSYPGVGNNTFFNQIHIVPRPPWPAVDYEVSSGGDSGSIWIEEATGKAVGLHFAGETDPAPISENAIANPITKVVQQLKISFTPVYVICPPLIVCLREHYCIPQICLKLVCYKQFCLKELYCIKENLCLKEFSCLVEGMTNPGEPPVIDDNPIIIIRSAKLPQEMRRSVEKMLEEITRFQQSE